MASLTANVTVILGVDIPVTRIVPGDVIRDPQDDSRYYLVTESCNVGNNRLIVVRGKQTYRIPFYIPLDTSVCLICTGAFQAPEVIDNEYLLARR